MTDRMEVVASEAPVRTHRIVVSRYGGPDVLQVMEEDLPEPGSGEVRVKVLAAGVSAYDLMMRRSRWNPGAPRLPFTPGVDVVGVVDAQGEGVSGPAPGEVVAGGFFRHLGGYAEYVCFPACDLVPVPAGVDPAEAVCLVVNYLTAHAMMHRAAAVLPGERVLVHGAAGGVGTALLELGEVAGLEMYGTASAHHHDVVRRLGATPIDYRSEDFVQRIRELTGDGVDVVFDPIGGARQLWRSYRTLRAGGRLIWFGVAAVKRRGMRVIPESLATRFLLSLWPDSKRAPMPPDAAKHVHETLPELFALLAKGLLHPVVGARIPLLEAARAHEILERGEHVGKLVLVSG